MKSCFVEVSAKMLLITILMLIAKVSCNFYIESQKTNVQCGGIFDQNQFIIQSPNYPSNYPSNVHCTYILSGKHCLREYNMQFLDFSLEDSFGCTGDRLEVEDKDALCGNIGDTKTYIAKNGVLQLRFVANSHKSGRGFRILVTRSSCKNNVNPDLNTTIDSNAEYCCERSYNNKRFYLTSPNFPYSNSRANCVYRVLKANGNVCRIRMHFLFYSHGDNDRNNCIGGYLEIDKKRFCGCRSGLKVIAPFIFGNTKTITYVNSFPQNHLTGFVLEVIQDECPKRINITRIAGNNTSNDTVNNKTPDHKTLVNKTPDHKTPDNETPDNETPDIETPDNHTAGNDTDGNYAVGNYSGGKNSTRNDTAGGTFSSNRSSNVTDKEAYSSYILEQHELYWSPQNNQPNFDQQYPRNRDVEETTYYDTSLKNGYLPPENDYQCRSTLYLQYMLLQSSGLPQQIPQCSSNSQHEVTNNCVQLPYVRGYFHSGGYPLFYSPNIISCYRIIKQQGYCYVRLIMIDFHVENSLNCMKDYFVSDSGRRFCGNSLRNTESWFDFNEKPYKEFKFVTDRQYCGRGFKAIYEQVKCSNEENPSSKPSKCHEDIRDKKFTIRIDPNQHNCEYDVIKTNPSICLLELNLLAFDVPCNQGYLLLQNDKYCGNLSGQKLFANFDSGRIAILFRRERDRQHFKPITMEGIQSNYGCSHIPPAERILQINTTSSDGTSKKK